MTTNTTDRTALELRSLIKSTGELELSLAEVPVPQPGADEVLVRIEASPLNPSDVGLLFGAADMSSAKASGSPGRPFPLRVCKSARRLNLSALVITTPKNHCQ